MPKTLRLYNPKMAKKRKCGSCTACCRVPSLAVLPHKQFGQTCDKVCKKGCSIYETRPEGCAHYMCHWLFNGFLETKHRPDKIGIIFDDGEIRKEGFLAALGKDLDLPLPPITAREMWPGAFKLQGHLLKMIATTLVLILVPASDDPNTEVRVIGPNKEVIDAVWEAVMTYAKEKLGEVTDG